MGKLKIRHLAIACVMLAVLNVCPFCRTVEILSGPSFVQATNAPLAGLLRLSTDVPSKVSVQVSDGTSTWERDFYDFTTTHELPVYGFKPGQTNTMRVTVYDKLRNTNTAPQLLTFVTAPLPSDFPTYQVFKDSPTEMEPGYTLFTIHNRGTSSAYIAIMDNHGQVVWYCPALQSTDIDVQQLPDGNLFIEEPPPANRFVEMDLLGQTVRTWTAPTGYPINSHVGLMTSHGTILYLSDVSQIIHNFPSVLPKDSITDTNPPLTTVTVDDNPVVEISVTNGALLNVWSPAFLLDSTRVTYLTADFPSPISGTLDTEHANAIFEDTNDDSIIVSQRDENTIYKFSRTTGRLRWILAPHVGWPTNLEPYLLTPVGTPFEWCYGQHAPQLTPQGTLMVFDDGEYRASPFDPKLSDAANYSRAVEYSIDETNMTISQVWDSYASGQADGDRIYSMVMGNADWLPQRRNVLVTYAWVNYTNGVMLDPSPATMARLVEYTHDPVPKVVFDVSFWWYGVSPSGYGFYCYRSHRIADFYAHPAAPVTAVVITNQNHTARIEFSADPTHNYLIQTSIDLINWTTLGSAEQDGGTDFVFADFYAADQFAARFYRVITQ